MDAKFIKENDLIELLHKVIKSPDQIYIDSDTDLISAGLLDSYTLVSFIFLLEEQYTFSFSYSDLRAIHFRTLKHMGKLLAEKYGFTVVK